MPPPSPLPKKTQSTGSDRASFFGDVSVDVGGDVLSFDDLEHGILRGNARHPYQVARRFDTPTGRRLGLTRLDHRVHFALNCGATSCPPVKRYTPEAIDEELRLAAMAFCEADDNVRIDEGERRVHLSKLMYWYQSDFGACDAFCLTHAVSKNRVDVSWVLIVQSTAGVFPRLFFFNSPI